MIQFHTYVHPSTLCGRALVIVQLSTAILWEFQLCVCDMEVGGMDWGSSYNLWVILFLTVIYLLHQWLGL